MHVEVGVLPYRGTPQCVAQRSMFRRWSKDKLTSVKRTLSHPINFSAGATRAKSSKSANVKRIWLNASGARSTSSCFLSGNAGLISSRLVNRAAKLRSQRVPGIAGSMSTSVLLVSEMYVLLSIRQPGLVMRSTVWEGCHELAEAVIAPQRISVAADWVESKICMLRQSLGGALPDFGVTSLVNDKI